MRSRLDTELVRRGLARSREQAQELIESGQIKVSGIKVLKVASQVDENSAIELTANISEYVSRGAHKLLGALNEFKELQVEGRICLDAGASTGGFTEVLLERGARQVMAVDVGYGQIAWKLRQDERVKIFDRTNIRGIDQNLLGTKVDLIVADLSFISLKTVLPALQQVANAECDYLLMVKPQFEVGRERLGAGGVVRDPSLRKEAILEVAERAYQLGLGIRGVVASPLPGPSGNVEYFLWLHNGGEPITPELVDEAIERGPK